MASPGRWLARLALKKVFRAPAQQQRTFHASSIALARDRSRRGGSTHHSRTQKPIAFTDEDEEDDIDQDFEKWAAKMQQDTASGVKIEDEDTSNEHLFKFEDDDEEEDYDEESDEETEEFMDEVDELLSLEPHEFEKRMRAYDRREASRSRKNRAVDDHDDEGEFEYDDDEDEIDRATERIPKKKLLKVLDELDPTSSRSGKNTQSMALPKTKNSAPLEKKPKKVSAEKVSYRQEKVELSVLSFVQRLIMQESDSKATDVIANLVDASVAPDLRRVILFWEPVRLNSSNQTISKRKVAGIKNRLERQEKWVRMQVTKYLNLKYSPIIQFKQRKDTKADDARAIFDNEMEWLNRF